MEDKTFELLTKMYSEFSDFRKDMTGFKEDMTDFKHDITKEVKTIGNQVTKLEYELKNDIKVLYDGYRQTYEKLQTVESKVDDISQSLEAHDIRLKVLEGNG